jgi:branched-chain amino acid transport system ATP-binding protein
MSDSLLSVSGLVAGYAGAPAVRAVDLSVGEGEVVALVGANGAGKTTTLRVISGLLRPFSGEVRLAGSVITGLPPQGLARQGIGHVPESRGVFHSLTVEEHFRLDRRNHRRAFREGVAYFPALAELRRRRAGLLSGGEQQMLAIARVLTARPRLLLLDELSLGLAPILVERLLPIIREFAIENGAGVLLVEQHIRLARAIADRAYVLSHGTVVAAGAADKLLAEHNMLLSSYLGDTTITAGQTRGEG